VFEYQLAAPGTSSPLDQQVIGGKRIAGRKAIQHALKGQVGKRRSARFAGNDLLFRLSQCLAGNQNDLHVFAGRVEPIVIVHALPAAADNVFTPVSFERNRTSSGVGLH
jgi:hypothetical protein